jgi:hypothetical protein
MASKSKTGGAKATFIRPWLCVAGVMFLWASQNQPADFTTASLTIWVLSSIAVGLIAGAACSFVQPLIAALGRASRDLAKARAATVAAAAGTPAAGADEP